MRILVLSGLFAAAAIFPALADDFTALPAGDGRDVTVKICSQCHSPELAASQRLDLQGWKDLVNQMANNGAQGTDADFNTISQYLATAFPATPAAGAAPAAPATPPPAQ